MKYMVMYRNEFEASIEADTPKEAVEKFEKGDCVIKPIRTGLLPGALQVYNEAGHPVPLREEVKQMDEKELAKEVIEEVKDQLRCRADAFDLKSSYRAIEKILREHVATYKRE